MWEMSGLELYNGSAFATTASTAWKIAGRGDFDGDGNADLLLRNMTTGDLAGWEMDGRTILDGSVLNFILDLTWRVQGTADFNGDGTADILIRQDWS